MNTVNTVKQRIRVSYAENKDFAWGHQPWFQQLISFLEKYFDVEKNVFEYTNTSTMEFKSMAYTCGLYDRMDFIRDTEIIIENLQTYQIVVISYSESLHDIVNFLHNPFLKEFYFVHYCDKILDCYEFRNGLGHRKKLIKPFFGLDLLSYDNQHNYDKHRIQYFPEKAKRKEMFCRARCIRGDMAFRKVLGILEDSYGDKINSMKKVSYASYLEEAKESKIALSYSHDLDRYYIDLTHRDMEYAMIGLPVIRIEFETETIEKLIPNYHYISIPRTEAMEAFSERGNLGVAELIVKTYDRVIDDHDLLRFVSKNLREWFDKYANPDKSIELLFERSFREWLLNEGVS